MRRSRWTSGRQQVSRWIVVALLVVGASMALAGEASSSHRATPAQGQIEATIFSFDGTDFVRTQTTLMTEDGKSAVDTKLEHNSPAYKALMAKRSYSGEATVFGKKYDANYAPLTRDGKLTGALFVAVGK